MEAPSRVATWAGRLGIAALLLFAGGPAAIQPGLLSSYAGFRIFTVGILLGLVAIVLGGIGFWRTRAVIGRAGRSRAVLGLLVGLAIVGVTAFAAREGGDVPAINDITTDPVDPPVFHAAQQIPANAGRDLGYPAEFAAPQQAAYPDLAPIVVAQPPAAVFQEARGAAEELGWEITFEDPAAGTLEATDTTRVFHFVDDIVIRVRPRTGGSVVDMRSKSRDGKGDIGTNARRIRAFRDQLAR